MDKKLKTPKKFETPEETEFRQRKLIKVLRRSKQAGTDELAELLETCLEEDIPCNSGACLKCGRRLRLEFLEELTPFVRNSTEIYKLTLVLPEFFVPRGHLNTLDQIDIKKRFQRFLLSHSFSNWVFIGSIDISLNSFHNADYHWAPHICVIVLKIDSGPSINDVKRSMRKAIERRQSGNTSYTVKIPMRVETVKCGTVSEAATYCFKMLFWWRSGYLKTKNLRGRTHDSTYPEKSLKDHDEIELRQWLAQWAVLNRMILVGISNSVSPNNIQLYSTPRTSKSSNDTNGEPKPKRVTRSNKLSREKSRRRLKRARRRR